MTVYDPPEIAAPSITVRELIEDPAFDLEVRLLAGGGGLDRVIEHPRIQKSGLVLVGHVHGLVPSRIQVLGETELSYAEALDAEGQKRAAGYLFCQGLSCVFVTRGAEVPKIFLQEAEKNDTPLVLCSARSSNAITALHTFLDARLAPRQRVHGVLVDVFEVGVMLLGKSGIGKSETALDLVMRGHRLVADDIIECEFRPPGMVFGEPAGKLRHHIEVRGLGILSIKDLYGVTAIRERKRIDMVVELELWQEGKSYDRLGLENRHYELLGVPIREYVIPVRPGRNMGSIIEIAARQELLKQAGHDPSREFIDRIEADLVQGDSAALQVPRVPSDRPHRSVTPPSGTAAFRPAPPPRRFRPPDNESAVPPPVVPKGRR